MKKIFALLALCFVVVCGAVGQETSNERVQVNYLPEFAKDMQVYINEHYPQDKDEWIYYWAANNNFALSIKDAKRLAQNEFKLEFREMLDEVFDAELIGGALGQEANEFVGQESVDQFVDKWHASIKNSRFSKYEYLVYDFYTWKDEGVDGFICFVLGRVPRNVVYGVLESSLDKTIKETDKKLGMSVFGKINEEVYEAQINDLIKEAENLF